MRKTLVSAVLMAVFSAAAAAAPGIMPEGLTLNLQGEASLTVPNDEAVLIFTKRSQKASAADASNEVVRASNKADEALKAFGDKVVPETVSLSTSPVYSRARDGEVPTPGAWRARATLRVLIKDVSIASDVLAACALSMEYDGISFQISQDTRRAQSEKLIRAAIRNALEQARVTAEELGLREENVRLVGMTVGERGEHAVQYRARGMMAADSAVNYASAAPQVSAGKTDVSLAVQVTAKIVP